MEGVDCREGALRCASTTTPAKCVDHRWVVQQRCSAAAAVCNQGVCGAVGLSQNGITVASGALSTTKIRLVEHGLELSGTVCGSVAKQNICVVGGIRP